MSAGGEPAGGLFRRAEDFAPTERAELTYRWDVPRGVAAGILDTGWHTFGLIVAIRVFAAPEMLKGLLAAGVNLGMLLTPLTLFLAGRFGLRIGHACAGAQVLAAVCLVLAAAAESSPGFIFAYLLGAVIVAQQIPLIVSVYAHNYAASERGWRFSRASLIAATAAIAFSTWAGWQLDHDLSFWQPLFLLFALAAGVAALAVARMPTPLLNRAEAVNPLRSVRYIFEDKVFGRLLFGWMFMGLGNLMTLPLRVEYLVRPDFGIGSSNAEAALLLVAIPAAFRLLSTRFWGRLFDRVDFIVLRSVMNLLFLMSMALFFTSSQFWVLAVSSALFGAANGGGHIAWQLWVTKIAPPERVSAYMSIHSATTGMRGVAAPFLAYGLLSILPLTMVAWIAACLLAFSFAIFLPARELVDLRIRERSH